MSEIEKPMQSLQWTASQTDHKKLTSFLFIQGSMKLFFHLFAYKDFSLACCFHHSVSLSGQGLTPAQLENHKTIQPFPFTYIYIYIYTAIYLSLPGTNFGGLFVLEESLFLPEKNPESNVSFPQLEWNEATIQSLSHKANGVRQFSRGFYAFEKDFHQTNRKILNRF